MTTGIERGVIGIRRNDASRIPRWMRGLLQIPLEVKLLGANLIIVGVAVLLLFGPVQLQPTRLTDSYIVVAALILGAAVNSWLVRLALGPLKDIERVATWVSQGRHDKRVPSSIVADRELRRLSITVNQMLDTLTADRVQMETLGADAAYAERAQVVRELNAAVGHKLADACLAIDAAADEMGHQDRSLRLMDVSELLRSAIKDIRSLSRTSLLNRVTDIGLHRELAAIGDATRHGALADVRSTAGMTEPPSLRKQA